MSFLKDMISKHKDELIDTIFDDELQEKLVKKFNDHIDIPFMSEKTEEKHLNALYDCIEDVIKGVLAEKL